MPSADLADEVGIDRSGLSRIEHGHRRLTVDLARRLCKATGLSLYGKGVSFSDRGTLPRGSLDPGITR